jgi:hypothetical protein
VNNFDSEINKVLTELKMFQSLALEKQKTNFKQQLAELFVTALPSAFLLTFATFLICNFLLIINLNVLIYLYLFILLFLLIFTIGSFLSFWQEETGIIKLSISIGKLYNLYEINSLKQRLEKCVDSGIVDEETFITTLNKIADDYYLLNKPIPNLNPIYLQFLKNYNLISVQSGSLIFNAKSKNELMKLIANNLNS